VTYHGVRSRIMARIMVSWHVSWCQAYPARFTCASRQQSLRKPFRGQVAAQSLFTCPIEDKAGDGGELPAELVIARFVGKQGLFVRSSSFDPLAEKFAGLDRARRRGRDLRILDILRTELAEMIVLNPRLGAVDHHAVGVCVRARIELEKAHGAYMLSGLDPSGLHDLLVGVGRQRHDVRHAERVARGADGAYLDAQACLQLFGESAAAIGIGTIDSHLLDVAHAAQSEDLPAGLPAGADQPDFFGI